MAQVAPQTITTLPPAPSISEPNSFDARAEAIMVAWPINISEMNAATTNVYNNAVDAYNSAGAAADSATTASIAASTAVAFTGATIWVSGTTYNQGDLRFSPTDFQVYRRTTNGAGTTDPKEDSVNWVIAVRIVFPYAVGMFYSTSF